MLSEEFAELIVALKNKDKKRYKYIVVYHNSCADGLTSAALFKIWLFYENF